MGTQLTEKQRRELTELVSRHQDVFSTIPGRTLIIAHDIITEPYKKVRLPLYRTPEARRQAIREEVSEMLKRGIIEKSKRLVQPHCVGTKAQWDMEIL